MVKRRKLKRIEKNVKEEQNVDVTGKVNGYGEESQVNTDFLEIHFVMFFRENQSSKKCFKTYVNGRSCRKVSYDL